MVELLVTIAILMVVSGVVFFNNAQFSNFVFLENLAYEISLTIRQAQAFSWQVRESSAGFEKGYGVYFNPSSDRFILFADIFPAGAPNQAYDVGQDEIVDELKLTSGHKIDYVCAGADCNATSLNISFLRPNSNAIIKENASGIPQNTGEIYLISPKGFVKKVLVNNVGQISILSL